MNILIAQNVSYDLTGGGASNANRSLLRVLAAAGHKCCLVAPATARADASSYPNFVKSLSDNPDIKILSSNSQEIVFEEQGVAIVAVQHNTQIGRTLSEQIAGFNPDWVLTSEDYTNLTEIALDALPGRVVYICHGSAALPFGPKTFLPNRHKAGRFAELAGVITVSNYLKEYLVREAAIRSTVLTFPVYLTSGMESPDDIPRLGNARSGYITLINPSKVKGIDIFLLLAKSLPTQQFAAVPTWATTKADHAALAEQSNVRILASSKNIDDILSQTRVLLVPSLWDEAFGLVAVEAMARGIPVLASDIGGLTEAKLGVDYILPVNPIITYHEQLDERLLRDVEVPEQDITSWVNALKGLFSDPMHYEAVAGRSREAAHEFILQSGAEPFIDFLYRLEAIDSSNSQQATRDSSSLSFDQVSAEKLQLLALHLKKKRLLSQ